MSEPTAGARPPGLSTRAVHAGGPEKAVGAAVVNPIHQTTTFFSEPTGEGEVLYTRYGNNPNHRLLESRLCALEGADECVLFASGMAAISCALLACVQAGDHVLAPLALYGGTRALLDRELSRLGIAASYVDFFDAGWERELRPNTRVVLVETPSNPLTRVVDLDPIAEAARRAGARVIVDATFATPVNFRPLEHGADLVMHSATKYLGGHSDVTAGVVCGGADLIADVRARSRIFGAALDPHAAWLLERGMKTLVVRMERHNRNALAIAEWCARRDDVARVHFPGLPSHPDHEVASRSMDGFGGMLGIELRGGDEAASRFVAALRLATLAPSLGGVETLVSEPRHTSHSAFSREQRHGLGIGDGFVRISVGIEDADDLVADLQQALEAAR